MSHEDKKRMLLDAALQLMLEHGPGKVSLDDIGARVGVSRSAVYHYFPSKRALLREAVLREIAAAMSAIEGAVENARGPVERLETLVEARFRYFLTWRARNAVSLDHFVNLEPLASEARAVIWRSEVDLVTQVLREGRAAGVFRPMDEEFMGEVLVAFMRGLDEYMVLYGTPEQSNALVAHVTGLILDGIRVG